jgi:AMMECR1 domain-containing protein
MQQISATKAHCKFCFDVLIAKLTNQNTPNYPENLPNPEVPIFVTWKKEGELRGCIGTFAPGLLSKVLPEYTITAGMKDPRFPPIKMD